ncbi:hypothetical protein PIB30_023421 [Stylosanthes scabra]|uniref:Adenylosuccinate lyase n=1 Tax=Stylosanthes scabra TaxID=79078 RepID=A0ABU6Y9I2_9FABA|nr:hypothetical protein [Stylosanthes scabra]
MDLFAPSSTIPNSTILIPPSTFSLPLRSSSSHASFPFPPPPSLRGCACRAVLSTHTTPKEKNDMHRARSSDLDQLSSLTALSPLDGRYWAKVKELAPFMSEYGLIYYRVLVEIKWLLKLSQIPEIVEVPEFQ